MGCSQDYLCKNCGYEAELVSETFDYGFSGDVVTPVVCPSHRIQQADTGLCAQDEDWWSRRLEAYPCPVCRQDSPLWDHRTCPKCGHASMAVNPLGGLMMWD